MVGKSREIFASDSLDSNTQIQRYIRLTNLIPEILDMVDDSALKETRKPQKIFPLFAWIFPGNLLIGDQACHRSDERAKSAEVGTDDNCCFKI